MNFFYTPKTGKIAGRLKSLPLEKEVANVSTEGMDSKEVKFKSKPIC